MKLIDFIKHMTPLPLHFEEDAWLCRLAYLFEVLEVILTSSVEYEECAFHREPFL
jgi:hypothetical protein